MEMNPEIETLLNKATAKLKAKCDEPVVLKINHQVAVGIISQLQLAFRHPANVGLTREMTERLVRDWIEQLDPEHTEVYQLLMMGFDEKFDRAAEPAAEEDLNWDRALAHFRRVRQQYQELNGKPGVNTALALEYVFRPLSERYHRGERSPELFKEMMAVE